MNMTKLCLLNYGSLLCDVHRHTHTSMNMRAWLTCGRHANFYLLDYPSILCGMHRHTHTHTHTCKYEHMAHVCRHAKPYLLEFSESLRGLHRHTPRLYTCIHFPFGPCIHSLNEACVQHTSHARNHGLIPRQAFSCLL